MDEATGNVFFTEPSSGNIARLNPATSLVTRWTVAGNPAYITLDSTGRPCATLSGSNQIACVNNGADGMLGTVDDTADFWTVPTVGAFVFVPCVFQTPDGITIDADAMLWFDESGADKIGRLDLAMNEICEYTKTGLDNPQLIASSGSGGLLQSYFTEGVGNSVSVLTQVEADNPANPGRVCTPVAPATVPMPPTTFIPGILDEVCAPREFKIIPTVFDVPGLDGFSSGMTKTAGPDGIPGNADDECIPAIVRFSPMPEVAPSGFPFSSGMTGMPEVAPSGFPLPSGMTGVYGANRIAGAYLNGNEHFEVKSGAIIAPPPPVAHLDHFKCYEAEGEDVDSIVNLKDQFGTETVRVEEPEFFCNPVDKNGEGIFNPNMHLTCYDIEDENEEEERIVVIENQFGTQRLRVKDPKHLCVPSLKLMVDGVPTPIEPIAPLDHFKCYEAELVGDFVEKIVNLKDQFGTETVRVKEPKFFCNPVDKNGEGIFNPNGHLTCYEIEDENNEEEREVLINNQFGLQELEVDDPKFLYVPSEKMEPTVVELASFEARANADGGVTVSWEAATEIDNAGFNIYRSRRADGEYRKVNDTLIPAEGNSTTGASYIYEDTPPAKGTYYYKLEDVDTNGISTMHGPVKVEAGNGGREARKK